MSYLYVYLILHGFELYTTHGSAIKSDGRDGSKFVWNDNRILYATAPNKYYLSKRNYF